LLNVFNRLAGSLDLLLKCFLLLAFVLELFVEVCNFLTVLLLMLDKLFVDVSALICQLVGRLEADQVHLGREFLDGLGDGVDLLDTDGRLSLLWGW